MGFYMPTGANECYSNLLETCACQHVDVNQRLEVFVCIEEVAAKTKNFDTAASIC